MRNERAWPNNVALRFGDHGTKEMLGVVGQQCCVRLHGALQVQKKVCRGVKQKTYPKNAT